MEEILEKILKTQESLLEAQEETNKLLHYGYTGKDPNEFLTRKDIIEQYGIGYNKVDEIFRDKNLPVQRYCKPQKVTRQAFEKYINSNHDYLGKGEW